MKLSNICISALVCLSFTACGGGGSSSGNSGITYKTSLSLGSDISNLGDFQVCADLNNNFKCEVEETSSQASSRSVNSSFTGDTYTFTSSNHLLQSSNLLAVLQKAGGGEDITFAVKAAGDGNKTEVNIKTTLETALMQGTLNEAQAKSKLNSLYSDLKLDTDKKAEFNANILDAFRTINNFNRLYYFTAGSEFTKVTGDNNTFKTQLSDINKNLQISSSTVLNDTGIKKFFDGSKMVDVETDAIKANYPGQDASHGFDKTDGGFKFTKLDSKGVALSDQTSTNYSCVKDERSGLIWEIKSDDSKSPRYKYSGFTHEILGNVAHVDEVKQANCNKGADLKECSTKAYVEYLNKEKYCGKDDWRLPTAMEQYNILDLGTTEKVSNSAGDDHYYYALDKKIFKDMYTTFDEVYNEVNGVSELNYWSSTVISDDTGNSPKKQAVSVMGNYSEDVGTLNYYDICGKDVDPGDCSTYTWPVRLVSENK